MDILSQNLDISHHSPQRQWLNRSSGLFFETYSACSALFLDNLNREIFSKNFLSENLNYFSFGRKFHLNKGLVSVENGIFFVKNCLF